VLAVNFIFSARDDVWNVDEIVGEPGAYPVKLSGTGSEKSSGIFVRLHPLSIPLRCAHRSRCRAPEANTTIDFPGTP
jgi:hypothetical protein